MSQIKEHKSITALQRIIAYVADDRTVRTLNFESVFAGIDMHALVCGARCASAHAAVCDVALMMISCRRSLQLHCAQPAAAVPV